VKPERILVVHPEPRKGGAVRAYLCERGFDAVQAASTEDALALAPSFAPGAALAEAALLPPLRELGSDAALVAIAPRLDVAIAALRAGADGYVLRPVDPAHALVALERALERRGLRRERSALREQARAGAVVVGATPAMRAVKDFVGQVGPTRAPVLLRGEPGTGKAHVARALHEASSRCEGHFVRASCAGLSELLLEVELFGHEPGALPEGDERHTGKIEQADGGTLYLQEVGRLPPGLQLKLLRLLQHGEIERVGGREPIRVDVRVIASSQRDLSGQVRAGKFRQDLYYRLDVVSASLPPLRARRDDLPALVAHFAALAAGELGRDVLEVSPGALAALFSHDWPGNVRELSSAVRLAVQTARGPEVDLEDLPPVIRSARPEGEGTWPSPGATLVEVEREAILRTLDRCGGSIARAAEILGISERKVRCRLKRYRSGDPLGRLAKASALSS
jgi:two-component system NtrC family response regulator